MSARAFYNGYVQTALWSSHDQRSDENLDVKFSITDLAPETVRKMKSDCAKFLRQNKRDLKEYARKNKYGWEGAGGDFWLTRNGHGAGFWDRNLGDLGDRLSDKAQKFGEVWLYVGDDEQIHT